MRYLFPLALFLFTCQKEPSLTLQICPQPEDLRSCVRLHDLPADDHFAAVVGEWELIFTSGGQVSSPNNCRSVPIRRTTLRADSTFTSIEGLDTLTGRWTVSTEVLGDGRDFSRLVTEPRLNSFLVSFSCAGGFAYSDVRSIDGLYQLYERKE